ncbi:MAG: class I SAM-dependent methyltransferase, partial [Bacillota bacterium]
MGIVISDKINEVYNDEFGVMGRKQRDRVHWICSKVDGEEVIDVGCSQGITTVLLAREGLKVLGVDSDQSAIDYAKNFIQNESEYTQNNAEFTCDNFMIMDFGEKKFDTVIAAEILEHITMPSRFIKKFADIMKPDGNLIITVPFGINAFFDHKKTYYLTDIIDELTLYFNIKEYKYIEKW